MNDELSRGRSARRASSVLWRIAVPVICALGGLLAATSMVNARGTDLRGGRYSDIIGLVSEQRATVQALQARVSTEQDAVDALAELVAGSAIERLQRDLGRLEQPASVTALTGPGVQISLDDAPLDQDVPDGSDPNLLIVHQQDLQAVVNALWAGGAEGISIQGQRIISTTGVKCVGNTVVLQGVPYAPPYRIAAVGDVSRMDAALAASPQVQAYWDYTAPPYNLGWSMRSRAELTVPAYTGALSLNFAKPATPGAN
jgi:uncharacterized protein YlxW (UPF0749 family)